MTRRLAGDGSIYRRKDGKWIAQLSLGPRIERRYVRRITATRRGAAEALVALRAEAHEWKRPQTRNLGDYLRRWLAESVRENVTPNTVRGYEAAIAHFAPIGHMPLTDVRAEDIEAVCNRMRATRYMGPNQPAKDIGPASPKTVRNGQLMLRAALEQAHQRGYVKRNEAKLVRLARVPRIRKLAMTSELARAILRAVEGDRYEAAYTLAMCGLRAGEVLGLALDDVDLEHGTAHIWHQLRGSGRHAQYVELKTASSEGVIDLPRFAQQAVKRHIGRHDPVALLFTTPDGYAVNGTWFTKHFQALIEQAGLPRLTIHDLRAGAATLLAAEGAHPSQARDFLRHADVKTTLMHYTRVSPEQRRSTARLLDKAVA